MRRALPLALAALLGLAATPDARGGAWLREKGSGMLSFSYESSQDTVWGGSWGYTSIYSEYGLRPRLTLGIDAGKGDVADDWKALVFLRTGRELERLPGRIAMEFGVGGTGAPGGLSEPMLRSGLSWGHGLATRFGNAWVNVDAAAEQKVLSRTTDYKLDLTLGLTPRPRTQIVVEFRAQDTAEADPSLRLVPSLARRLGQRTWLRLGGSVGLHNDDTTGLILGSRVEF